MPVKEESELASTGAAAMVERRRLETCGFGDIELGVDAGTIRLRVQQAKNCTSVGIVLTKEA